MEPEPIRSWWSTTTPLHRDGTRKILEQHADLQVAGDAESGEVALAQVNQLHPSIVLMDIRQLGALRLPVHQVRFWLVQFGVVTLAVLHDVVLVDLDTHEVGLGVPAPITSGLLLIPVIYAALNFGVRGAVGTASGPPP